MTFLLINFSFATNNTYRFNALCALYYNISSFPLSFFFSQRPKVKPYSP